jgi:transposase
MKQAGLSNHEISRQTGKDRRTIRRVWERYCALAEQLDNPGGDLKAIQAAMTEEPRYAPREGVRRVYTPELEARLREIVEEEDHGKARKLGAGHKQKLTNKQIHEKLEAEGFTCSRALINIELANLRRKAKEVFIRQEYDLGDRLEYDFGEVRLDCGSGVKVYHMAVFSSPGGGWRWAYLYTNQKIGVFLDSHVKMFEMLGGCFPEVVYDNMRNVVTKFIGQGEKLLNEELVKMARYYGYRINVTNCFSGNEKGHVEGSVKIIRNKIFSGHYVFASFDEAREYLHSQLLKMNENSQMAEEKQCLTPYKPPLELAAISEHTVSHLGFFCLNTCFYSVPEYLVGHKVTVKLYHDEVHVYAGNDLVCKHKRIFGNGNTSVDIRHYLDAMLRKPGAVRNSVALRSVPKMKAIFDTYYSKTPKKFIEIFIKHREKPIEEILAVFEEKTRSHTHQAIEVLGKTRRADERARANVMQYAELIQSGAPRNPQISWGGERGVA